MATVHGKCDHCGRTLGTRPWVEFWPGTGRAKKLCETCVRREYRLLMGKPLPRVDPQDVVRK